MADVFWTTYPIVLTAPSKYGIPVIVVTEQNIDITVLAAPDKVAIGDAVEEILPIAIAAGFFYNGSAFVDYTTEANEATANDVTLLEDSVDFFYVGADANMDWIAFNIGTAGTAGNFSIEYSTAVGWSTLPSTHYASSLNAFKTAGMVDIFINAPSDWADQVVNGETRRWIRFNCSGNYTINPLATQIWTNTISTNRFLATADVLSLSDSHTVKPGKVVSDSVAINEFTTGFYFTLDKGVAGGLVDFVVITDVTNIPQSLAIGDTLTITELFSTLNGPRLIIADVVTIIDLLSTVPLQGEAQDEIINNLLGMTEYGKEWMGYIAIGTGTTAVDELRDDQLETEIHRKKAKVWSVGNTHFSRAVFGQDEPTGDDLSITEVGIFADASGGNMGRRWLLNSAVSKDNIDELPIECRVVFFQGTILDFNNTLAELASIDDIISMKLNGVRSFSDNVTFVDSITFLLA